MDSKLQEAFAKAKKELTSDRDFQQSSFNEAISKGSLLGIGEHLVTITGVTIEAGMFGPQMVLILANEEGASSKKFVNFQGEDKETNKPVYHKGYTNLISSLVKDPKFIWDYADTLFLKAASGDNRLANALSGLKLRVVVEKAKKGFEVIPQDGKFLVTDVGTGETLIPTPFDSIDDAVKVALEERYKRAYPRLSYLKPVKELELLAINEEVMRKVFSEVAG